MRSKGKFGLLKMSDLLREITIPALRNDLTQELFREITRQVPFLHDKDPSEPIRSKLCCSYIFHLYSPTIDPVRAVTAAFVEIVAPHMTLIKVDKDDYVVTEGERGTDLFFVLAGTVHCEYETDDGRKHTLMKYSAGQYFGDVAMFILEKNIVSYKATGVANPSADQITAPKCELYMLPRYVLLQLAFETKDGNAYNHAEVKHEMQALANEKLRLLSQQIALVDRLGTEQWADGMTNKSTLPTQSRRVLSRVLDAADAAPAPRGTTISSDGSGGSRDHRRSPR